MREHRFDARCLLQLLGALAVDLAIALALLVAGGAYWFGHEGVSRIAAARQSSEAECAANGEELRAARAALAAAQVETEALRAERDAKIVQADALAGRIQEEQQFLTTLWEEQRPLIERASDLQARITRMGEGVHQRRLRLGDLTRRIEGKRSEVSAFLLAMEERRQTLGLTVNLQAQQVVDGRTQP